MLLDIANPLDFSHGLPPSLFVTDTDSLGEQIQAAFPDLKVVKALNTLTAALMVDPGQLAGGQHSVFVAGNDADAKKNSNSTTGANARISRHVTEAREAVASCRVQRVALPGGEVTWTVLGADHCLVGPAEQYLEFLRSRSVSPNTVKSYARGWRCGGSTLTCSTCRGIA